MIIVDASVWAGFFAGFDSPQTRRLDGALRGEEDVGLISDSLSTLLAGLRRGPNLLQLERLLLQLPIITPSLESRAEAAALLRTLKSRKVRVQDRASCLVAQACIELEAEVLSHGGDYDAIARHTRLRICKA